MTNFFWLFIIGSIYASFAEQWFSKSQCTQKEFANHMDITCEENQWILIGWSHYGTKRSIQRNSTDEQRCEPAETDCIMDYTHKIAELCNGISRCEVILTQQFIHKCSDEATYLFISYQCVHNSTIVDICSQRSVTSSSEIHLISPSFPNEYPNLVNCTCTIQSNDQTSSTVIIDVENLSFNLQDNDRLVSLSGTSPFGASLFKAKNELDLRFQTDETLSQSGFWIRLNGHHQCHDDEYSLGSKCLKIFFEKQNWQSAEEQCLALNSHLILLNDIIEEKKLTHFFISHQLDQQISLWISTHPDVHSWWPWRSSSSEQGKCVLRTADGWYWRSCDEEHSFICERNLSPMSVPLTLRCGQNSIQTIRTSTISTTVSTTTLTTSTTAATTTSTTSPLAIRPLLLREKMIRHDLETTTKESRTSLMDPNLLAAILGGVAVVIFSMNVVVCYMCRRRTDQTFKGNVSNESQSSLTHEDFQHSLMQQIYPDQMNTISSTSTSSSKQSQSKSNETATSHVHLSSSASPSIIPVIKSDQGDYHFYETIPAENAFASTMSSAFRPVLPSNSHTIRPFLPRTSYQTLPNHPTVVPICCYHSSNPIGTMRGREEHSSHVLPPNRSDSAFLGSESIV